MVLLATDYVRDLELAQDLVQDVFVHLLKKKEKTIDNPEAYFFRATRNKCLDYLKSSAIHAAHHQSLEVMTTDVFFDQSVEMNELTSYLMQWVEELPEQQKRVFQLSRMSGKTNDEIALAEGISKRTVETHISKALKVLRSKLTDYQKLILIFFS